MKLSSPYLAARSALLLWRNAAYHRQILRAMLSVSLFVAITKFIGAAKEMAIAAAYGTSLVVDAYVYLTNLLNLPSAILSSGMITVLVPYLVRLKPHTADEAAVFKREFLGTTLLAGGVVALVAGCTMFSALVIWAHRLAAANGVSGEGHASAHGAHRALRDHGGVPCGQCDGATSPDQYAP